MVSYESETGAAAEGIPWEQLGASSLIYLKWSHICLSLEQLQKEFFENSLVPAL